MKRITIILVFILMASIVGIAGCTSQNNSSYNTNYTTNDNLTPQTGTNNTPTTVKAYEATGYCNYVVDGDTIDVQGVGRIRFVGVNTPERGQAGYQEAKNFITSLCLGKTIGLDIDNSKNHDKYGRTLAVVYVGDTNLNAELLKRGYAEVMYIPPSEFNPYSWTGTTNYNPVSKSKSSNSKPTSVSKSTSSSSSSSSSGGSYVANSNTGVFHYAGCRYVARMNEGNKVFYSSSAAAKAGGYRACLVCKP